MNKTHCTKCKQLIPPDTAKTLWGKCFCSWKCMIELLRELADRIEADS